MTKERELLYKFAEHVYNNTGSDDALIVQKNIDSFIATRPDEKEEKTCKTFMNGDSVNDVLDFIYSATTGVMEVKDKGTTDERYEFVKETKVIIEFNPSNQYKEECPYWGENGSCINGCMDDQCIRHPNNQ